MVSSHGLFSKRAWKEVSGVSCLSHMDISLIRLGPPPLGPNLTLVTFLKGLSANTVWRLAFPHDNSVQNRVATAGKCSEIPVALICWEIFKSYT